MSFYGKLFASMYDGTLYGKWQALVTFQQFIILSDAGGIVDMTPHAIAARTSIPLEIIQQGISELEQPDPYSRSPADGGRRIERLDDHRPWGWRIVNHAKYRDMRDAEGKRDADRERLRVKRAIEKGYQGNILFDACTYCDSPATGVDRIVLDVEDPDNIVPCCQPCNASKNVRTLDDFVRTPAVTVKLNVAKIIGNPKLVKHLSDATTHRLSQLARDTPTSVAENGHLSSNVAQSESEAESEAETEPEKTFRKEAERAREKPKRGTRLPSEFVLTDDRADYAKRHGCHPERTFEIFTTYWRSKSGAGATKVDWDSAWQHWCLKDAEKRAPRKTRFDEIQEMRRYGANEAK